MNPVQNENGQWVIPATRRPDGTWRKEKLLKEGFVPQEEIRAFETRATKQANKGIPGLPPSVDKSKPKHVDLKEKVRSKPVVVKSIESDMSVANESLAQLKISAVSTQKEEVADKDPTKRLKALKKKLRDIVQLSIMNFDDLSLEQKEKLSKKEMIEQEILSLGEFDK